jgi:hypothetical protein
MKKKSEFRKLEGKHHSHCPSKPSSSVCTQIAEFPSDIEIESFYRQCKTSEL